MCCNSVGRRFLGKQDELIGSSELSNWMAELFPQGEARKHQLMELARMPYARVLSIPSVDEFDAAQAATLAETIPIPRKSERSRSLMIAVGAALMAIGGAIAVRSALATPESMSSQRLRRLQKPRPRKRRSQRGQSPPPSLALSISSRVAGGPRYSRTVSR